MLKGKDKEEAKKSFLQGIEYDNLGRFEEALECYLKFFKVSPDEDSVSLVALSLGKLKRYVEALDFLEETEEHFWSPKLFEVFNAISAEAGAQKFLFDQFFFKRLKKRLEKEKGTIS